MRSVADFRLANLVTGFTPGRLFQISTRRLLSGRSGRRIALRWQRRPGQFSHRYPSYRRIARVFKWLTLVLFAYLPDRGIACRTPGTPTRLTATQRPALSQDRIANEGSMRDFVRRAARRTEKYMCNQQQVPSQFWWLETLPPLDSGGG
jgi:hypothetical protein